MQEAVDLLGSPEVVLDDKHGPKLFSRFLAGLLAAHPTNSDSLSPLSAKSSSRRLGTKSKGKGREVGGAPHSSSLGSELSASSPSNYSEMSSPGQHLMHMHGSSPDVSRGHSPATIIDTQDSSSIHSSELFQAAIPVPIIDQELLDSMQFMADPVWQDTTVPG